MKEELLHELEITAKDLLDTFEGFSEEEVNTVPPKGGWTPARVMEHLRMATGLAPVLRGKTWPTEGAIDGKIPGIKQIFLDFSAKYESPEFVFPEDKQYNKTEMYQALKSNWEGNRKAAEELDPTETVIGFELPGLGEMTRLELLWFAIIHTQRHIHQLKEIRKNMQLTEANN